MRELTLQLSDHFEAVVVSVGDLLKKEVSKKTEIGHRIDEYIRNMLYAPDSLVVQVLRDHIAGLDKTKNIIIEGFPKTLYQSMAILQEKILPDLLLVVNYSEDQCNTFLKYAHLTKTQVRRRRQRTVVRNQRVRARLARQRLPHSVPSVASHSPQQHQRAQSFVQEQPPRSRRIPAVCARRHGRKHCG